MSILIKRIFNYLAFLIVSVSFLIIYYINTFNSKESKNLNILEKRIDFIGITQIDGSRGKIDVLTITFNEIKYRFIYLKSNQNYSDLLNSLKIKDSVKIFYDIDYGNDCYKILELEKNGLKLISLEQDNNFHQFFGYFLIFASIITLIYAVNFDKKYWVIKNKINS